MTQVFIHPAPSFDEPVEMLVACHGRVEAQLDTLRRLAVWLPENGADEQARQAATAVLRYFKVAAVNHHQDEEADIFPRLLERVGPEEQRQVRGLIRSLLSDHEELAASWESLRARLEVIQAGLAATLPADDVLAFSHQYRSHIECEESMVVPLMQRLLTPQDLTEIGASMAARRKAK